MQTIRSKSALFFSNVPNLAKSLWFRSSFIINNEPIEPNLNGVFGNKYGKIWGWLRNYDNLWEFTNSSISVFYQANICLHLVQFEYQLVYRYSNSLPMITNEELFSYIWLFVILGHLFDEQ